MDLSMLAYWTIRQRLLGVPGVANIAIWGEQLKMLQVMVDPKRLASRGRYARPGAGSGFRCPRRWPAALCPRRAYRYRRLRRNTQSALSAPLRRRRRYTGDAGQGAGDQTGRQAAAVAERRGRSRLCAAGHDWRCRHQRRPRPHAHRREISLGQHARRHPRGGGGAGEDEARPARGRNRYDNLPAGDFRRGLDRQPVMGAVAELPAGRVESYSSSFTSGVPRSSASSPYRCRCSRLDWFCSGPAPRSTQ